MPDTRRFSPHAVIATFFGTGHAPIASGTFGSLAALLPGWLILYYGGPAVLGVATLALFPVALWSAGTYAHRRNLKDPSAVVIDEVIGQWIPLLLVPPESPAFLFAAFALFRIFDVAKPWPVGWADQKLEGAWGIVLDDILAGGYALLVLALIERALS